MEYNYTLRLKKGEPQPVPVALVRNGKVILGGGAGWDDERWIANRPESQAVTVAVEFFQLRKRLRTDASNLSRSTKANIREAKRNGATIPLISRSYNLQPSVVKAVLRG